MMKLENFIANDLSVTLNSFLYNSINLFKYNTNELSEYVMNKCQDNPLIFIDEDKIPLSVLSYKHEDTSNNILSELSHYFNYSLSKKNKLIMRYIVYSLNSNGFLEAHTEDIAAAMNTKIKNVEYLINILQNYENKGIGSKNIIEFLAYQLEKQDIFNEQLFSIFISHMDYIQKKDYSFLKSIDVEEEAFLTYVDLIKSSCELFPLSSEETAYIAPDASILLDNNNNFKVQINDYLLESVTFEPINLVTPEHTFNRKIENYKKDYDELISILNARKIYLADILTIIVNVQGDYLKGNSLFLETLDQTMLSDYTSLSPATISRLLHNKFVATPLGVLPIKSLLSKKCSKNASVSYVMYLIKNVANFEKISDNKISALLRQQGVAISRRTVNKYKNLLLS